MEESYETFEEELGPSRAEPPPQKPVRQIRRPEMYAPRKIREDTMPVSQQLRSEPKILTKEPSFSTTASLHKSVSIQNLAQVETPWESVTLNRCLFVAITILVLTSGFHRLSETLRGQRPVDEEEDGLMRRPLKMLHNRGQPLQPEKSLWEVMLWWLPDLDDDAEDNGIRRGRSKTGGVTQTARTHRNRQFAGKKLLKQRDGKLKERRTRKRMNKEIKDEETEKTADMKRETTEEREEETVPKKNKSSTVKKEKKQIKE
ncbi:uncharacterized protein LOC101163608 [Oryzias latipes]|uniref:uncharacterized protein LOC101163608 n=1 Tax=Oryzias latipes TaxID=8090 RepID=UPI0000EA0559|nr:uncharacterized protein LOC101163608 [Oryzias latipes]XP_023821215.1 uncharacterized protein LOC101163608 [Oryzias latipes]XP_023821216.1 uncharacterized protein LOC101163608 [Oryzias latipes]